MKRVFLTFTVVLLLCAGYSAQAQQKAALVIGNNDYKEKPLQNAVNDANLMTATLQELGFTVQKALNVSKTEFENQLIIFNRNYKNAGVRFFYYAGHGIQFEGKNYLVPVDATLEEKESVAFQGMDFSNILSLLQKSNPNAMNIFVLDACRNDPFKNRSWGSRGEGDRGLVLRKADFTTGSFAAFSADNGQLASDGANSKNGLYTKVLAEELLKPGTEINIIFQRVRSRVINLSNREQTPVEENRLVSDKGFFFIPPGNNEQPVPVPPVQSKYYYYVDQNGNESKEHFTSRELASGAMKGKNLYGRIYSNSGEVFVVDKPVPVEPEKPVVVVKRNDNFTDPSINLEMVYVAGGSYTMGCTSEQGSDCRDNEKPAHQVSVSSFYIGKYPVTQAQWKAVMGNNPSYFKGDNLPVENVSWDDVQEFIQKLNRMQSQYTYRLPSEEEWEYAARGGNKSNSYKYSGSNNADYVAWYENNSGGTTHPAGTKSPNELGIYDMSGNVYEWCSSCWRSDYNASTDCSSRVLRGGSWYYFAELCRVSFRSYDAPGYRNSYIGFRLVLPQ